MPVPPATVTVRLWNVETLSVEREHFKQLSTRIFQSQTVISVSSCQVNEFTNRRSAVIILV